MVNYHFHNSTMKRTVAEFLGNFWGMNCTGMSTDWAGKVARVRMYVPEYTCTRVHVYTVYSSTGNFPVHVNQCWCIPCPPRHATPRQPNNYPPHRPVHMFSPGKPPRHPMHALVTHDNNCNNWCAEYGGTGVNFNASSS